jgi:nitroimidazol reductase NimA-like FMN-containing flavoprotein (pyridoxamine 5'-phosphate oxidase superfamily)
VRSRFSKREKAYLAKARVARVASIGPRGRVHVAPFCHAFDPERRTVYIATDRSGTTARNVRSRAAVGVACDDYFEDWDRIRGLVVQAKARTAGEKERELASKLLKRKFRRYRSYEIDYVIALDVTAVTSWGI